MGYGEHKVPDPLQDEDKWLGLTKPQWVAIAVPLLVVLAILKITFDLSILPLGVFLSVVILLVTAAVVLIEVPEDKYLLGSGNKMSKILLRYVLKKLPKNKKIYTKNLDNGFERWKGK